MFVSYDHEKPGRDEIRSYFKHPRPMPMSPSLRPATVDSHPNIEKRDVRMGYPLQQRIGLIDQKV